MKLRYKILNAELGGSIDARASRPTWSRPAAGAHGRRRLEVRLGSARPNPEGHHPDGRDMRRWLPVRPPRGFSP